jgi:diacylglycerol kinase (ATP)
MIIVGPVAVLHGTHVTHPMAHTCRAVEVTLACAGITACADGERQWPLPIVVTSAPGALRLLS